MKCKLCGSKYVEMREPRHELGRIVYVYYCHSCKRSYEEDAVSNAGSLTWLMTFDNDQTYMGTARSQAEFNMNSEGKLVVNQLDEGKHSTASCSPKMHVKKAHYGGNKYYMEYDSFRSATDVNGVLFKVKKIEMNPQLTAEALKNEAMKALHKKDNLFVINDQYSTVLLNDAIAWLSKALGGGPQKKGCYVATCVYGSYDCPEVWTLRRFRDDTLAGTWYGRAFIRLYYAVSPTAVKLFGKTKWFVGFWKKRLDKLVAKLQADGVESTYYKDRPW